MQPVAVFLGELGLEAASTFRASMLSAFVARGPILPMRCRAARLKQVGIAYVFEFCRSWLGKLKVDSARNGGGRHDDYRDSEDLSEGANPATKHKVA